MTAGSKRFEHPGEAMHALALLLLAGLPAADKLGATLESETARIQRELRAMSDPDPDLKDSKDLIESFISHTSDALKARRYYLGLEELSRARVVLDGVQAVRDSQQAIEKGMPGFEGEWAKTAVALKDLNGNPAPPADVPAVVAALAQSAQSKAIPVLDAAHACAAESDTRFGFYYLGSAKGAAAFADFCSSLKLARERSPAPLRSVSPELEQLQEKVVNAFRPPRSIQQHSEFIRLNGALKLTRELDAAKHYEGALYHYLDAVQQHAALEMKVPDAAQRARIRKQIGALNDRLHYSDRDESIAELFVERAAAQVGAKQPTANAWKSARAIVDVTLPAYFEVLKAPGELEENARAQTTVTLIRSQVCWPRKSSRNTRARFATSARTTGNRSSPSVSASSTTRQSSLMTCWSPSPGTSGISATAKKAGGTARGATPRARKSSRPT